MADLFPPSSDFGVELFDNGGAILAAINAEDWSSVTRLLSELEADELDLKRLKLGVDGAKAVGEGLANNKTLLALKLRTNGIKAEGAKAVAVALQTLEGSGLRYNSITA